MLVSRLRMMIDEILARRIDAFASSVSSESGSALDKDEEEKVLGIVKRLVELNGLDQ